MEIINEENAIPSRGMNWDINVEKSLERVTVPQPRLLSISTSHLLVCIVHSHQLLLPLTKQI